MHDASVRIVRRPTTVRYAKWYVINATHAHCTFCSPTPTNTYCLWSAFDSRLCLLLILTLTHSTRTEILPVVAHFPYKKRHILWCHQYPHTHALALTHKHIHQIDSMLFRLQALFHWILLDQFVSLSLSLSLSLTYANAFIQWLSKRSNTLRRYIIYSKDATIIPVFCV